MSSKRTYTDYLRDILDAVEKVEEFTVMWRTVQENLPPLRERMTRVMDDLATGETDSAA